VCPQLPFQKSQLIPCSTEFPEVRISVSVCEAVDGSPIFPGGQRQRVQQVPRLDEVVSKCRLFSDKVSTDPEDDDEEHHVGGTMDRQLSRRICCRHGNTLSFSILEGGDSTWCSGLCSRNHCQLERMVLNSSGQKTANF
jgi:hypothetical protein